MHLEPPVYLYFRKEKKNQTWQHYLMLDTTVLSSRKLISLISSNICSFPRYEQQRSYVLTFCLISSFLFYSVPFQSFLLFFNYFSAWNFKSRGKNQLFIIPTAEFKMNLKVDSSREYFSICVTFHKYLASFSPSVLRFRHVSFLTKRNFCSFERFDKR